MKNTSNNNNYQLPIPFSLEGNIAPRTHVREIGKISEGLYKISFSILRIRPGFNARRQGDMIEELYERSLMIPELAAGIFDSCGPAEPILGDFYKADGCFYITNGERRFRAIRHLLSTGVDNYPNGTSIDEVTVLVNPAGTTDLERKRKVIATQDNLKLKPIERAFYYLSFKQDDKMSHADIAKFLNVSRQTVDNYIMATELDPSVQMAVDAEEIKITAAIADMRKKNRKEMDADIDEELLDLKKKKKEKKEDSDIDDYKPEGDNSVTFPGSMGGFPEAGSGAITIGKDSIYKDQEDTARWKQFVNRYSALYDTALVSTGGDVEKAVLKLIECLKQEFVIQVK